MRTLLGVAAALAISTSVARAQPVMADDDKDPMLATCMSAGIPVAGLVATIVGGLEQNHPLLGIGVTAMVLGPSSGRWYGHEVGTFGLAARVLAAIGIAYVLTSDLGHGDGCEAVDCTAFDRQRRREDILAGALVYGGFGAIVATTVYDVVLARRGVGAWNREHAIAVTPTAIATPTGSSIGLGIGGRF